jgi:predicted flap endonuclease-1-like 5' DNA nuclease
MFEDWLKFWRQWMSFWLPGGDEPAETRQTHDTKQGTSTAEARNVDAAATWRPASSDPSATGAEPDDLTKIKGIGPAIGHQLDGFGVKTFTDLAAADPEDLAKKIGKRPVTPDRVRDWIAEAKKRAS